ncbi:hypothetical protein HYV50_01535 [Candidatus Pacearchaeota archaeon]|nr:hypothetical protein [Candidatus Pacearchaeota archaeon]
MKIGIDIDGVLADFITPFLAYYNVWHGTGYSYTDITNYELWSVFGDNKEQINSKIEEYFNDADALAIRPINGSQEIIQELNERNGRSSIITSRPLIVKEKTLEWLFHNFQNAIGKVYFTEELNGDYNGKSRKSFICRKEGIEVMIEDLPTTAIDCSGTCRQVLLYDHPWNRNWKFPKNVSRVKSWNEINSLLNGNKK